MKLTPREDRRSQPTHRRIIVPSTTFRLILDNFSRFVMITAQEERSSLLSRSSAIPSTIVEEEASFQIGRKGRKEDPSPSPPLSLRLLTWNIPNAVPRCSFVRATVVVTIITPLQASFLSLFASSSSRCHRPPSPRQSLFIALSATNTVVVARSKQTWNRAPPRHHATLSMRCRTSSVHTRIRGVYCSQHHKSEPASPSFKR